MGDNGIYIDKDEFLKVISEIKMSFALNTLFDESEQVSKSQEIYTDVQGNGIIQAYRRITRRLLLMTDMCCEMTLTALDAFQDIGEELLSIDGLMEKCVNLIKNGEAE